MDEIVHTSNVTLLMRAGNYQKMKFDFENNQIVFSCAANWIDYAKTHPQSTIGDISECAFAHLDKDFDFKKFKELLGPNKDPLNWMYDIDKSIYLSASPIILSPALCFFAFTNLKATLKDVDQLIYLVDIYVESLKYSDKRQVGVLFINNPVLFQKELIEQIPIAIYKNKDKFQDSGSQYKFDPQHPIATKNIDYCKNNRKDLFKVYPSNDDIFKKSKDYQDLCERRYVIAGINYKQSLMDENYNYRKNLLTVKLPYLHEYAKFFQASQMDTLVFSITQDDMVKIIYGKRVS